MLCSGHSVLPSAAILQPHFLSSVGPSPAGRSELSTLPFPRPMDKLEACESSAFWSSGPRSLQPQFSRGINGDPAAPSGLACCPGGSFYHSFSRNLRRPLLFSIYYSMLITSNHFIINQSSQPRVQTPWKQIAYHLSLPHLSSSPSLLIPQTSHSQYCPQCIRDHCVTAWSGRPFLVILECLGFH